MTDTTVGSRIHSKPFMTIRGSRWRSSLSPNGAWILIQTAWDVLHLDRLSILLADPEDKWLQAVASIETEEALEAIRVPIGPAGGWLAQAYQTKKAIIWNGQGPTPEELRLKPPYDQKGLSVSGLRHPAAGRSESNIRGSGGRLEG
jgi:hypothetical protein